MSRLKDRPFEIISVALDDEKQVVEDFVKANTVPGLQLWDDGSDNPVARQYNIESMPTTYLLDRDGVIRARDVRGEDLIKEVEKLLGKKAEGAGGERKGEDG